MIKKWAIYAGDLMYGGLHGMCEHFCVEAETEDVVCDIAHEASIQLIQSYSNIYDTLEMDAQEQAEDLDLMSRDDFDDLLWEIIEEDVEFNYWQLNEKADEYSITDLDRMFCDDPERFISKFCVEM